MFCARIAIRLVPLATGPGIPMNSITGTVSRETRRRHHIEPAGRDADQRQHEDLPDFQRSRPQVLKERWCPGVPNLWPHP